MELALSEAAPDDGKNNSSNSKKEQQDGTMENHEDIMENQENIMENQKDIIENQEDTIDKQNSVTMAKQEDNVEEHKHAIRKQYQQQQRDSQQESLAKTMMTLANTESADLFATRRALERFLAGDERLSSQTWPLFHPRQLGGGRGGHTGEGEVVQEDEGGRGEEELFAELTVFEMISLHIDTRLLTLSWEAGELKHRLLAEQEADEEEARGGGSARQHGSASLEATGTEVRRLARAASALHNLVSAKLRPWRHVFEGPRLDDAGKEATLDMFVFTLDTWLRDQYKSSYWGL